MHKQIIDLTRILNNETVMYPGTPQPAINPIFNIDENGFSEHLLSMVSHPGTHIDAPSHVIKNGKTIDQFPLEKFVGKAIVISCKDQKEIGLDFLRKFEDKISQVEFILFYTGWQARWKTERYIENCPIPTQEAAQWLTRFNLKGLGVDAFSLDHIGTDEIITPENLPNHFIFLGNEILLIENLCNLDQLPEEPFMFNCVPLFLENVDGSPIRAFAITG